MWKLGTLEQFNRDDTLKKKSLGWSDSEIKNGKIFTDQNGDFVIRSVIQKTQNPNNLNECVWKHENGDLTENDRFNILSHWRKSIIRPLQKKWFIAYSDSVKTCGTVEIGQAMVTGLDNLEIFDDEDEFLSVCDKLGIKKENEYDLSI